MRRKIIALLLAMALGAALTATALGAEEAAPAADLAQEQADTPNTGTGEDLKADAAASAADAGDGEATEDGETAEAGTPVVVDHAATPDVPAPDAVGAISFVNIAQRVRENNFTYQSLSESIASIDEIDFDKQIDDLRDQLNLIAKNQYLAIISPTGEIGGQTYESLQATYDTLKETFDDLKEGKLQYNAAAAKRQLEDAQNQLVKGAEALYISVVELQTQRASLQRTLDATDRSVAEMELRYSLGQISALTLQQVKSGRASLASSIATLDTNLYSLTCQFQQMIGAEITGSMTFSEVPEVTEAQVTEMDFDAAFAAAKETSYTLYAAQKTLDDAEDTFEDAKDQYGSHSSGRKQAEHTWTAAQYTYQASVQSYELSFRTMFDTVANDLQVLKAAQTSLALAEGTFASQELKYQQGNLSKNAYLDAQDDLAAAQDTVATAKHDLFTAYRNYYWAVEHGVLS